MKETTEEAVGRQRQRVDRSALSLDTEGCGGQTEMEGMGARRRGRQRQRVDRSALSLDTEGCGGQTEMEGRGARRRGRQRKR